MKLHILLTDAHIGPRPGGMETRHLDGNPMNNHISNLRYGTRKENAQDRIRHGTQARGEQQFLSKLTEDNVREIRKKYVPRNYTRKMLAKEYGVSVNSISMVIDGQRWTHVDAPAAPKKGEQT